MQNRKTKGGKQNKTKQNNIRKTCLNEVSEVCGFAILHCYVHPLFHISTLVLSKDAKQWTQLHPPLIGWDPAPTTYGNVSCNHSSEEENG